MKCLIQIIPNSTNILCLCFFSLMLIPAIGNAQKKESQKEKSEITYHFDQYVMVTLKNGSEVPAKVSYVKSKSQYSVRMIGGSRSGSVSKKHLRAMTPQEITDLKVKQKKGIKTI